MTRLFDGLSDIFVGTFGQAVTVLGAGRTAYEIRAIYRNRSVDDLGIVVPEAVLHVRDEDAAPLRLYPDARVMLDGVIYVPRVDEPDGKGTTTIRLERNDA